MSDRKIIFRKCISKECGEKIGIFLHAKPQIEDDIEFSCPKCGAVLIFRSDDETCGDDEIPFAQLSKH